MRTAVIGAGIGGLILASRLARLGFAVDVYDLGSKPGGKMSVYENSQGLRWDTGPTLMSLPEEILDTFLEVGGVCPSLLPLKESCRFVFPDGTTWSIPHGREGALNYFESIDPTVATELDSALAVAEDLFDFADEHIFDDEPPSWLRLGIKASLSGLAIKYPLLSLKNYEEVVQALFTDPHLREIFYHFASYVGCAPSHATSGILAVAHVEMNTPIVFPQGGVYAIAENLYQAALKYKVQFHFNTPVQSATPRQSTTGKHEGWDIVASHNGETFQQSYDLLVCNSDPFVAIETFLKTPELARAFEKRKESFQLSPAESQFVILYQWENPNLDLLGHHVKLMPKSFLHSFNEVHLEHKIPSDPNIYLVWPHATDPTVSPEVLFISAMCPNLLSGHTWDQQQTDAYAQTILNLCRERLNQDFQGKIMHCVTPKEMADRTGSPAGTLYSMAPQDHSSTFFASRSHYDEQDGLFFVGGGVHPGVGVSMVMKGARRVFEEIEEIYKKRS